MSDEEKEIIAQYNASRMWGPYKAFLISRVGHTEKYGVHDVDSPYRQSDVVGNLFDAMRAATTLNVS